MSRVKPSWFGGVVLGALLLASVGTGPLDSSPPAQARVARSDTIVIGDQAARHGYDTPLVTITQDGTLSVVNLDAFKHTVTTTAADAQGEPLIDVEVAAGQTVTVPQASQLAAGSYHFYCRFHPSMRGTLVVEGSLPGQAPVPPRFEQRLVVPEVITSAHPRITMRRRPVRVLPDGRRTPMWTYGGSWPGPTIRRPTGEHTSVTFVNRLPRSAGATTVHLHGDHHASQDDGQPTTFLVRHHRARTYEYPLTYGGRPEPSSFFFYHDHRMDKTSRNNWRGLQGMFIVDDPAERRLPLPKGDRDVPLLVADRSFTRDNGLTNPFLEGPRMVGHHGQHGGPAMAFTGPQAPPNDATVGTHVLVNGRFAPYLPVRAVRYRLRLLNGSNFSSYNFALSDGRPFVQVGTGNGLLRRPVVRQEVLLGPAQRADVVVDFHGATGRDVVLSSVPRTDGGHGTGSREAAIMAFRVGAPATDRSRVPARLPGPRPVRAPRGVDKTWTFGLGGDTARGTFWSVDGRPFDPTRVGHRVRLGSTERWRLRNTSDTTHYVHIHAEQWRTVSRDGRPPPAWERGLEDTWRLDPGEYVDVAARFEDHTGPFMIHCHMLDHEDHGMMSTFVVVDR